MLKDKKIVVVMPAYNAAETLEKTYREIPLDIVDEVILVDDMSADDTVEVARKLGIRHVIRHEVNKGYGGNQKTCYRTALSLGADVVIMLHPDYQYTPLLIESISYMIVNGLYPVVLASRILGNGALKGGMPRYKYFFNRCLTFFQNVMIGQKLSEYHTGYRAFTREVLETVPFMENSDDFVFDNQMLAQVVFAGFDIGEVTCPTKYFPEASSINFRRSCRYGFGVIWTSIQFRLQKWHMGRFRIFRDLK